ncbi:hypothetical protein MP638_002849 [Amoeboaphelidium occidentale]|nr:hypothetical protein MP638_002849 [Amoeboaphelidium occidentale]
MRVTDQNSYAPVAQSANNGTISGKDFPKYSLPNSPMASRSHHEEVQGSGSSVGMTNMHTRPTSSTMHMTNNYDLHSNTEVDHGASMPSTSQGQNGPPQSISLSDLSNQNEVSLANGMHYTYTHSGTSSASAESKYVKRRSIQQELMLSGPDHGSVEVPGSFYGLSSPALHVNHEEHSSVYSRRITTATTPIFSTSIPKPIFVSSGGISVTKSIEEEPHGLASEFARIYSASKATHQTSTQDYSLNGHDKDEFFRVVGVKQTYQGTTSRVVVYLAPSPHIKPVGSDSVLMITTTKPGLTRVNKPSKGTKQAVDITSTKADQAVVKENIVKLDTSKIMVRFSNDVNEKIVKGEWKGRARSDELYGLNSTRELVKYGGISSDKSGFVPFNTLCKAQKLQALYLCSDLRESGLFNGAQINSFSWKISDAPDRPLENFRIAYRWVQEDSIVEFQEGLDVCYGPVPLRNTAFTVNEWMSFQLNKPLEWDGRSNLLLEISKDEGHSSFSWPATGGIFFKTTTNVRTLAQKDNNDSSGQYPFTNWQKPTRFRKVPCLSIGATNPSCFKIVCVSSLASLSSSLISVDVALDGQKFTKDSATFSYRDIEPIALNKLITDLSKLLDSSSTQRISPFSDVLFQFGSAVGTPVDFYAHSVILSGRSPVFKALFANAKNNKVQSAERSKGFAGNNGRAHAKSFVSIRSLDDSSVEKLKRSESDVTFRDTSFTMEGANTSKLRPSNSDDNLRALNDSRERITVRVNDLRPGVFYTLLRFLYTGSVEIDIENACELLVAAARYDVQDLIQSCEEFLKQSVNIENVTSLLLSAEKWKVPSIRSFCLDFVLWHFDAVSKTEGFANDLVPKHDLMREILISRKNFVSKRSMTSAPLPISSGSHLSSFSNSSTKEIFPEHIVVSFPNSLLSNFGDLLKNSRHKTLESSPASTQDSFDVTFAVGEDVVEQVEYFSCHKAVITSRCEVFEAMFSRSGMKEAATSSPNNTGGVKRPVIPIPNISPTVFWCILQYLYTSKCDIQYDLIFELYRAADQYMLEDLKQSCEEYVMQELTLDNVATILVSSDRWSVGSVKSLCMDLCVREFDEVSVTSGFLAEVITKHDLMLEILRGRNERIE